MFGWLVKKALPVSLTASKSSLGTIRKLRIEIEAVVGAPNSISAAAGGMVMPVDGC